jgi:hypothetical protein
VAWYLISFEDGAMNVPEDQLPDVADAARAVLREAVAAGVFVFAGGLAPVDEVSIVAGDGTVADGPQSRTYSGGVTIVDVPTRADAVEWAGKIAVACRCAQEVREFLADPVVGK